MHKQAKGSILLLLCAMIWGGVRCPEREYAVYRAVYDGRGAFFSGGVVLLPVIAVLDRKGWSAEPAGHRV